MMLVAGGWEEIEGECWEQNRRATRRVPKEVMRSKSYFNRAATQGLVVGVAGQQAGAIKTIVFIEVIRHLVDDLRLCGLEQRNDCHHYRVEGG
jgi:hypothetical protein